MAQRLKIQVWRQPTAAISTGHVTLYSSQKLLFAHLRNKDNNPHAFKLLREVNDVIHVKYLTKCPTHTVQSRVPLTISK